MQGKLIEESFHYIEFSNMAGQSLKIGYDRDANEFYIDRENSGKTDFSPAFTKRATCPRIAKGEMIPIVLIMDVASVEVFFDDGLSVMTATFFPDEPLTKFIMAGEGDVYSIDSLDFKRLKPIW
jgi:fructan beta-fructosidase